MLNHATHSTMPTHSTKANPVQAEQNTNKAWEAKRRRRTTRPHSKDEPPKQQPKATIQNRTKPSCNIPYTSEATTKPASAPRGTQAADLAHKNLPPNRHQARATETIAQKSKATEAEQGTNTKAGTAANNPNHSA